MLFYSPVNTVDIHKINLLSKEINPIQCSHGNDSHAAQFQSWDFIGSLPSWSSCFPGRSGPRNGRWQLKLRNASLESELLGTRFSHPAPALLLSGFPGELWETLDQDEIILASRFWQVQSRPTVPTTGRPAKVCILPNTGADPGKALSHLKGSWPQVPHPRLHMEEQSRRVIQQGGSSESSGALHHSALCVPGAWPPPVGVPTGGTPSSCPVC